MSATIVDRPIVKVSASEMVEILCGIRGATMISFVATTVPRLLAGNPWVKVVKTSKVSAVLNFDYEKAVNRQRLREGKVADFKAEPRKWGSYVGKSSVVEHKGNFYINVKVERSEATYMADGEEVAEAEVESWIGERHSGRQKVEKAVSGRDFKIENVRSIRMKGTEYIIID
jgi:hypothetical protein